MLVLQAGLAGRPVPGQQVGRWRAAARSRAPGPARRSASASGRAAGPAAAPDTGVSGSSSAVRRNRMERPSSRTNSMPARLGTINCGASAHSSTSTLTRLPVSGSVSLRSAGSTTSAYDVDVRQDAPRPARRGTRTAGRGRAAAATISSRGASRSVPTSAPSGAPASPAVVSGTRTSGRSARWRCRTVASGWARPLSHGLQPGQGADQRHSRLRAPPDAGCRRPGSAPVPAPPPAAPPPGAAPRPPGPPGRPASPRGRGQHVARPSSARPARPARDRPSACTAPAARARSRQWKASSQAARHSGAYAAGTDSTAAVSSCGGQRPGRRWCPRAGRRRCPRSG